MKYHGLFIGIDRYGSSDIDELSCAENDAVALHALFADTLGDGGYLLTNQMATRQAIWEQFEKLAQCDETDVVIITFSGHGSETHELVTFDADINDLVNTTIPLETLTEWFAKIPARRLVCILDCCFSGGMGAKVLHVPVHARTMHSVAHKLEKLSGDGRLIITASNDKEEAWENTRAGHGLLTYYLLEALQGAEEVRQNGRISVYRLLQHVTDRVKAQAITFGKIQHPTVRGKLDDALVWDIFVAGEHFHKAFPKYSHSVVTSNIDSLQNYGFPPAILEKWAQNIPSLNQLQLDAINEFNVLKGEHLVVSAPTSSGKTMIGELAALKSSFAHKRSFFLLPLRALVNDKHQQFIKLYSEYGLRIIRATGEFDDEVTPLLRGQYDICLLTYEKFAALILSSPYLLEQVGTIIIDEVQMIADDGRGANLEFLMTLIKVRRQEGIEPQLVALSAVIGDTNGLEQWLGARLLRRTERPVPLSEGVIRADGSFRFIDSVSGDEAFTSPFIQPQWSGKNSSQDYIIPLVKRLVSEGKQVIVFRESKGETQGCAEYLARDLGLSPAEDALNALPIGDMSDASRRLRLVLTGGVAFHNANLERNERLVIEQYFRVFPSQIRVIVATTTLAMGINTPAEAVIVVGLEHPSTPPKPYSIAEYKNIVGRAGRLGFTTQGESYLLATSEHLERHFWSMYIQGTPENIQSRFFENGTDTRSLVIKVLVAVRNISRDGHSIGLTLEQITQFLAASFGAFQKTAINEHNISSALQQLAHLKLIEQDIDRRYTVTNLGRVSGETGVEIETIVRVIDVLRSLSVEQVSETNLVVISQISTELDDIVAFPINKRASIQPSHAEYMTWFSALQHHNVPQVVIRCLSLHASELHQPTLRAKKAASCLLWMSNTLLSDMEGELTKHMRTSEASGAIRSVKSRVGDVLPAIIRVAEILHPQLDFSERGRRLLTRLDIGIPNSITDLALFTGTKLTRGDYLALVRANLSSIKDLEQASDEVILEQLGGQNSLNKVKEIRRGIRSYHEEKLKESIPSITIPRYDE